MFTVPVGFFNTIPPGPPPQTWETWNGTYDSAGAPLSDSGMRTICSDYLNINQALVIYSDGSHPYAVIVDAINTETPTYGTPVTLGVTSPTFPYNVSCTTLDTGRVLVAYYDASGNINAQVLTVSGNTLFNNAEYRVANATGLGVHAMVNVTTDQSVICYAYSSGPTRLEAVGLSTSGETITVGTPFSVDSSDQPHGLSICALDTSTVGVAYGYGTGGNLSILSVSGNSVSSIASPHTFYSTIGINDITCCSLSSSHMLVGFVGSNNDSSSFTVPMAIAASYSGSTISLGSTSTWTGTVSTGINSGLTGAGMVNIDSATSLLLYGDSSNINAIVLSTSGLSISPNTPVVIASSGGSSPNATATLIDSEHILVGYLATTGAGGVTQTLSIVS